MNKAMRKVLAGMIALTIAMSAAGGALAADYPSRAFKLPAVKARPTEQITADPTEPSQVPSEPAVLPTEATEVPVEESEVPAEATEVPAEATEAPTMEPTETPVATEVPETIIGSAVVTLKNADSELNVRAEASSSSKRIATLKHGDVVGVYGSSASWTHILTQSGVDGYVASSYLKKQSAVEPTKEPTEEPTVEPTEEPTVEPTEEPTVEPTEEPTVEPTEEPTVEPTEEPTVEPTEEPTVEPTEEPTVGPTEAPAEQLTPKPTEDAELKYGFERDENGALVLDESGNPIATIPEGMTERPTRYLRDANGDLVLDESGDPIVIATVPIDAEIFSKEEDDQNRVVTIYVSGGGEEITLGGKVTLIAELEGFDDVAYTLQWENSTDGVNWSAVEGGDAARYTYTLTEEVNNYYWRMTVTTEEAEEQSPAPRAESGDEAAGALAEDAAV